MILFLRQKTVPLFLIFAMMCFLVLPPELVFGEETLEPGSLYSTSCALMDGDSGRVLYGKKENDPMANASTTKIMTCILALENASLEDIVTASAKAAAQPKVHLGMVEGQQFYLQDLLYALMLESYNDCAVAIAEHVAGSREEFAKLMNAKAASLGCKDTYFITPNGLDDQDENGFHHTTAEDLCRIMKYCAWESEKSQEFLSITQTANYSFADLSGRTYALANHNAFLGMMEGVITGKTGFTGDAGYCYVAALESQGRKYCIALLACGWPNNKTYKWKDAKALFQYGIDTFTYRDSELPGELEPIHVSGGCSLGKLGEWGQKMTVQPVYDADAIPKQLLLGEQETVTYEISCAKNLTAPVADKEQIGTITYYLNDKILCTIPIYPKENLREWEFKDLLKAVFAQFFCPGNSEKINN